MKTVLSLQLNHILKDHGEVIDNWELGMPFTIETSFHKIKFLGQPSKAYLTRNVA